MSSAKFDYRSIYRIDEEINRHGTIPAIYQSILQERLVIACTPLARVERMKVARSKKEINKRSKARHATKVYLTILDQEPGIFLAFIIAVSPSACGSFKLSDFLQQHTKKDRVNLKNETRLTFEGMAQREQVINRSIQFRQLIDFLFNRPSQKPKPITGAESDKHFRYDAADLNAIRFVFGMFISDCVERAPVRIGEKSKRQATQTTECVRTRFPHLIQDGIIWIDIGPAAEIAGILFPPENRMGIASSSHVYDNTPDPAPGEYHIILSPIIRTVHLTKQEIMPTIL